MYSQNQNLHRAYINACINVPCTLEFTHGWGAAHSLLSDQMRCRSGVLSDTCSPRLQTATIPSCSAQYSPEQFINVMGWEIWRRERRYRGVPLSYPLAVSTALSDTSFLLQFSLLLFCLRPAHCLSFALGYKRNERGNDKQRHRFFRYVSQCVNVAMWFWLVFFSGDLHSWFFLQIQLVRSLHWILG